MLQYPQINPYIFELGVIKPTWYGLMYVIGFYLGYWFGVYRSRYVAGWNKDLMSDVLTYLMLGVIVGGRLGYVLFYGLDFWAQDWLYPLKIMDGGMSFHGGLLGVIVAAMLFAHNKKMPMLDVGDFIAPLFPIGLFFGRLGNFINGELWGRTTDLPWGMVFPTGGPLPRHPSQLYEMFLEGFVLFFILWGLSVRPHKRGMIMGAFLLGYGVFRTMVEFVREPDSHLNFIAFNWLTMGQLLSLPMMIVGLYFVLSKRFA